MAVQTDPTGTPVAGQTDNRLTLVDQAFYAMHRAAGQKEVMQVAFLYEHPVDMDAVKRFHRGLADGLLGRLIERPPLPFGRYRWVSAGGPTELDISEPRPRTELAEWLDERAQMPLDPESGPGWRLSVVPFTDGSTLITLVISHYVVDGVGSVVSVAESLLGVKRNLGYPPARSRTPVRAAVDELAETVRQAPTVGRAFVRAVAHAIRHRKEDVRPAPPAPPITMGSDADDPFVVPNTWIIINQTEWDSRAKALGGTASTLAVAYTAKLAEQMGRRLGAAGTAPVQLVVNDRTAPDDARAVAVAFTRVDIDPAKVTTDLTTARADIKQALKTVHEESDELAMALTPLTPFTPRRLWKYMVDWATNDPDQPSVCSILGDVGDVVIRIDGTSCERAYCRGTSQHMTRRRLDRTGGQLQVLFAGSAAIDKVQISIQAYQPGGVTTKRELLELAERTLAEFDLTGHFE